MDRSLDQDTLTLLDEAVEVDIRTPRRDGSISSRPIWVVVVDGEAYVRSYLGPGGAWYKRARADGAAVLDAGGREIEVGVEDAGGDELDARVSDAFRAKYGARSPGSTEAMVTPEVTATTLRLIPPQSPPRRRTAP
jgi:hypothetical protein